MTNLPVESQILCQQCTAVLPIEQGEQFVTCSFCGTTNFVDKSQVVLRYAVRETIGEDDALAALRRWMAGNETVKDLDKKAKIESPTFQYFPMWMVRVIHSGQEQVFLEPAAALSVSELKQMTVPAADLELYDPYNMDPAAVPPTVSHTAMRQWLADDHGIQAEAIREVSLVHLPIYLCKYEFDGKRYTTIVDAATSKVFANLYPSKWEIPYLTLGAVAFIAYFCAALVPLGGYFLEMMGLAILAYCVIIIVLAIPIFGVAALISAKV